MDPAYDNNGILILHESFGASTTVVIFAAFGVPPNPVPQNEFHNILYAFNADLVAPGSVNIITVVDKERRFYLDGNSSSITKEINKLLEKMGTVRAVAIGLSMGGFAAVSLAKRLHRCDTVIAFGAHSAINPSIVPFDDRSPDFRAKISHWDVTDSLNELDHRISYRLFYGQKDRLDMLHAARFRSKRRRNIRIEIVPDSEHNVVSHLYMKGTIKKSLWSLIFTPHEPSVLDAAAAHLERLLRLFWRVDLLVPTRTRTVVTTVGTI